VQAEAARCERIIVGSTPVSASAWSAAYAAHRAKETSKPILFLSASAGAVRAELVGCVPAGSAEPACDLASATRSARAAGASLCIVRTHTQADEPGWVGPLTILTGHDTPALMSAYAALKDYPGATSLRIVFVGCDEGEARQATARLARTLERFLPDLPGPAWSTIPRAVVAPVRSLFAGPCTSTLQELADAWMRNDQDRPSTVRAGAAPFRASDLQAPAQISERREPRSLGEDLGLRRLPHRCPDEPAVELACDADGSLHLLLDASNHADPAGSLLAVSAWASRHADLLAAACPEVAALGAGATLHLVSSDFSRLRRYQHTGLCLHLLAGCGIVTIAE
jgi:hypothetical protein